MADFKGTDSMDFLIGSDEDDRIFVFSGDDYIEGGMGSDHIEGSNGEDLIYGDYIDGSAKGNNLNDTIYGDNGNDYLSGNAGDDYLDGGNGDDFLSGESGNDILTGGGGSDTFYFQSPTSEFASFTKSLGVDTITDFTSGADKILLSKQMFAELVEVKDFPGVFATVSDDLSAEISSALIVYNSANGSLFYNQNGIDRGFGNGGQFAVLNGNPTITASDFQIESMNV